MTIPGHMFRAICGQAEATYPDECCGVVFARVDAPGKLTRVRPCRNAQDELHALDPEVFPRTARDAYFVDPGDLLAIARETRERNEVVRVIYHSHPDADAYFSEEDQRRAISNGEPVFPEVQYLVVSVRRGTFDRARLFEWNPKNGAFGAVEPGSE